MPNSAPTPSFPSILHKGLQKGLTHGLYPLSKRRAIEVSGRKEPKVVLTTLGNDQPQNTSPNSCPRSESILTVIAPVYTAFSKSLAHLIPSRILEGREGKCNCFAGQWHGSLKYPVPGDADPSRTKPLRPSVGAPSLLGHTRGSTRQLRDFPPEWHLELHHKGAPQPSEEQSAAIWFRCDDLQLVTVTPVYDFEPPSVLFGILPSYLALTQPMEGIRGSVIRT